MCRCIYTYIYIYICIYAYNLHTHSHIYIYAYKCGYLNCLKCLHKTRVVLPISLLCYMYMCVLVWFIGFVLHSACFSLAGGPTRTRARRYNHTSASMYICIYAAKGARRRCRLHSPSMMPDCLQGMSSWILLGATFMRDHGPKPQT